MKICLIISSLRSGGAERVLSTLANYWLLNSHQISLITLDDAANDFYAIEPRIQRYAMKLSAESNGALAGILANVKRILAIRKIVRAQSPDVVLSFMDATNILACIALVGTNIPLVVSERIDPTMYSIGRIRKFIRPYAYSLFANAVVVQTQNVLMKCKQEWPYANLLVISNPLMKLDTQTCFNRDKILLSVGRLELQKGHDVLIQAFSNLVFLFPDWNLKIVGEGPERKNLQTLINQFNLQKKVTLPGSTKSVFSEYAKAEVFCLASRYEGFPNALLEALASGCACISTDCESGPRDILEDGRLGILTPVDDVNAMSEALRTLMASAELRTQYGSYGPYVWQCYNIDKISQQWFDLFTELRK
jgi:GalNAc-alpha-(1->4)-GalNAc-alpha-(1->3)-diNAcBac-PP-undecaprenol alpha-1,4-N-acetyl-D-galactosaminyltransferase